MAIRSGDTAVPFVLPAKPGKPVDVGASIGTRPVVLLFFPLAYSPTCTEEMCAVRESWGAWSALEGDVFGITVDSPYITEKFRADYEIPFPILSDFNREVAGRYGALHEDLHGLKGVPKRACFVINAGGVVVHDWVSDDPSKMPDLDGVREALAGVAAAT